LVVGEKVNMFYKVMEWTTEFRFREFDDKSWNVQITNKDFLQFVHTRDLSGGLAKYMMVTIEEGFINAFFDVMM